MNKAEKKLAQEIIAEKQADNKADALPSVVVRTVKTLIVLVDVAKIFTNERVDEILDRLKNSLEAFIVDAGV